MAAFPDSIVNAAIGRQNGRCGDCGDKLNDVWFEAHHLLRRADGGRDTLDNCVRHPLRHLSLRSSQLRPLSAGTTIISQPFPLLSRLIVLVL
ncbi:HNH endonuclease [Spirosoma daeguense]